MEAMGVMQLGKIAGTAMQLGSITGPAIPLAVGIAGTMAIAMVGIQHIVRNRDDATVVSMTPVQQARSSTRKKQTEGRTSINRLSDKQIVEIEVVMKRAQIALEIEIKDADREQPRRALVASGMRNAQHRTLKLYGSGSLSGKFVVKPYPELMFEGRGFPGLFLHQGPDPDDSNPGDSEAYVIYGTSDNDRPRLLYILAWSKPANGSRNKVYVQAGLLPNMLKLPDNEIEQAGLLPNTIKMLENKIRQKLNAQFGVDESSSYDPETGAEAAAKIGNVLPGSNLALLGATFSRREH